jgi:hypothetical protein
MSKGKKPEDENLIPGNWPAFTKPDLINRGHRWATQTTETVSVKDQHKGLLVALLAIVVGCLAYGAVLILGYHHYAGIFVMSMIILLVGSTKIFRSK